MTRQLTRIPKKTKKTKASKQNLPKTWKKSPKTGDSPTAKPQFGGQPPFPANSPANLWCQTLCQCGGLFERGWKKISLCLVVHYHFIPLKTKGFLYKKSDAGIYFYHTWYVFKQWNAAKNPTLSTSQNLYWNCIPFQSTAPPWNLHLPSGAEFKFGKGTSGGTESQNGFCFSNLDPTLHLQIFLWCLFARTFPET